MKSLSKNANPDYLLEVDTRFTELSRAFILLLHRHHEERR